MNLAQLEQQLAGMVAGGNLTLDASSIPGNDVGPLFGKFLGGTLALTNVRMGFPPDITTYFQILGTGASDPFNGMAVSIQISQPSDFELLLNATAPSAATWSFATAWPKLGKPFDEALPSAGFDFASFTLDSTNGSLTFSGNLLTQSVALLPVSFLFPGQTTLAIKAPVDGVTAGWPHFSMSAPGTAFIPNVPPVAVLTATPATGSGQNAQSVGVEFTFSFAGGITIGTQWPFTAPLTIEGTFDGAPFGFNELASIFDFGPSVPPQLTLPDSFGLTSFGATIDQVAQSVDLTVSAGTPKGFQWQIASFLTLTELDFVFGVNGLEGLNKISTAPGSGPFVTITAQFEVGQATQVVITGAYPGFVFSGTVQIGQGGLDLKTLVGQYYEPAAAFVPDLSLDSIAFTLDPNSPSFSLAIEAEQDKVWTLVGPIGLTNLSTSLMYAGSNFNIAVSGTMVIGPLQFMAAAAYSSSPAMWSFNGSSKITAQELSQLLDDLGFKGVTLPARLTVTNLSVAMTQTGMAAAQYTFGIAVALDIPIGSFDLTITGSLVFTSANSDVVIGGSVMFGNLLLAAKYDVNAQTATFDWDGIMGTLDVKTSTISFTFTNVNIGQLVDRFVDAVTGTTGFSLVSPFDLLNSISFSSVVVAASLANNTKTLSVTPTFSSPVDLGFVKVTGFTLTTDFTTLDVALDYSSFLGGGSGGQMKWNALDPSTTPAVPGAGAGVLSVQYLLLAQRVAPISPNALDTSSVKNAVTSMMNLYKSPPGGGSLVGYSASTDWVIGTRLLLLNGTITINAVFVDPGLYGIDVTVGGMGQFAGLDFEVLYKRVTDTIGVYEIDLTLPTGLRQMSLGGVAFSLPTVTVQIYTNGNFYIDFGFPYNNDWSKSFSVQLAEFVGMGGFYFGVMNGATANLPAPSGGTYAPVILIGLAASVGFGGAINFGVLSGSISLTMSGSAEGIFAWFNPANGGDKELWYQITGKFALVGRITGSIDFVIVSATFSIVAMASITIRFGSEGPVQFTFTASVSVSATIKILFVKISFSFSASITESFTIGDSTTVAQLRAHQQRRQISPLLAPRRAIAIGADNACSAPAMNWVPITGPLDVALLLTPHFTSASAIQDGKAQTPAPQIVVMTYIATMQTGDSPFTELAQGALLWAINALLQVPPVSPANYATVEQIEAESITVAQLEQILCALQQTAAPAIPVLDQVLALLPELYQFQIANAPDSGDTVTASVFPILPALTLTTTSGTVVDFSTFNPVDAQQLQAIQAYFAQLVPKTPGAPNARRRPKIAGDTNPSMASVILGDYFILLCRTVVQAALTSLSSDSTFGEGDTIAAHIERRNLAGLTPEIVAAWNRLHRLRAGIEIALPDGGSYAVTDAATDTLLGIARRFHTTIEELARANQDTAGFFADGPLHLPGDTPSTVGDLITAMTAAGAFDAQAGTIARMLMQGLRPPFGGATTSALYALTGQQFDASGVKANDTFTLDAPANQTWIVFEGTTSSTSDVVTITEEWATLLQGLDQPLSVSLDTSAMLPARNTVPKNYGLSSPVIWNWTDKTPSWSIWKLPDDLLETVASGVSLQLELEEAASDTPGLPDTALSGLVDEPVSSWAMAFPITVRLIPSAKNPSVPMQFTYNLLGTDDTGSQLLLDLLQSSTGASQVQQVYVLFPQQPGSALPSAGVSANPVAGTDFFVLQTNFSTSANPADVAVERIEAVIDPVGMSSITMLQAIWECSVVRSGGYYFYYRFDDGTSSSGLPSFLFDSDGEAELTLVVTLALPSDGSVTNAMNTIVVQQTFDPNTLVYLQPAPNATTVIEDSVPAYQPGETAFTATRTFPVQTADVSIDDTYQLLGYQIAGNAGFDESNYGVPISPTDPQPPATAQVYNSYVPIAASAVDPGVTTPYAGAPPAAADPYRGIGETVQLDLDWFDVFGNVIEETTSIAPLTQAVYYFDYLIPVTAWPSLGSSYAIALDGTTPTLTIDFLFDSTRYQPQSATDQSWLSIASADLAQYASIYYQIARNVTITASTSLDADPADVGDLTQTLLAYVVQIYAYLQSIVAAQKWTQNDLATSASLAVKDDPQPPDTVIFQLQVLLTIERTGFVDPIITNPADPAVSVSSAVRPTFLQQSATTTPSLAQFALDLNQCFPTLLVATGDVNAVVAGTTEQVWLVRFGENGITCTYDGTASPLVYYAMLPLAGSPVSPSDVQVPGYATGQGLLPSSSMSFTNVDVDLLAGNFLAAVDQFLSADYAAPAWVAVYGQESPPDPDPVTVVLEAKQTIAAAIATNVAPILKDSAPTAAMLAAAQEQLKQEVLVRLSSAYDINALVQFTPTASGPSGAVIPPNLYGQPVTPPSMGTEPLPPTYAFSPVSIPLTDQASIVTFSFTTNDRTDTAIQLPVSVALNHLQFNIVDVASLGYQGSSWLSFAIPLAQASTEIQQATTLDLGTPEIPIPLRAFPSAPSLAAQTTAGLGTCSLDDVTQWQYGLGYSYTGVTQDEIHVTIQGPAAGGSILADEATPLVEALLQFTAVYPQIAADLYDSLADQENPAQPDTTAIAAITAFSTLVDQVAQAWPGWKPSPVPDASQIQIAEESISYPPGMPESDVLQVQVTYDGIGPPAPAVDIPGFTRQTASASTGGVNYVYFDETNQDYLTVDGANAIPQRAVTVFGFDVLAESQAAAALVVKRNETYGDDDLPGNPLFVLTTPAVQYITPAVPQLTTPAGCVFDLTQWTKPPATIDAYLQAFFTALFGGFTAPAGGWPIQMTVTFTYNLGEATALPVTIPVGMLPPTGIAAGSTVIDDLATFVSQWMTSNKAGQLDGGMFNFALSLFGSAQTMLPLLTIPAIQLSVSDISEE